MNHYDVAVRWVQAVQKYDLDRSETIALTQVHATLALVDAVRKLTEQQAEAWRRA